GILLAIVLILETGHLGGPATPTFSAPTPLSPLHTVDATSPFLERQFDWEVTATDRLNASAMNVSGETAAWTRDYAGTTFAKFYAQDHNITLAIDDTELAYEDAFALSRGFASPDRETQIQTWKNAPGEVRNATAAMEANITAFRPKAHSVQAINALALAELAAEEARAVLDVDWPAQISSAKPGPEPYPNDDGKSYATDGTALGRADRRLTTADFWLSEARAAEDAAANQTSQVITVGPAGLAYIEHVRADSQTVTYERGGADDSFFYGLAHNFCPYVINQTLDRGWTEGALEAAFRANSTRAVVLEIHKGYLANYTPTPDSVIEQAWVRATAGNLTAQEAADAAYAGPWLTKFNGEHARDAVLREAVQALVLATADHRDQRPTFLDVAPT